MHTLTIAPTTTLPALVTNHPDRATARAALAAYVTATDTDPQPNQITTTHESYDLVSIAHHGLTATATIEPSPRPAL
ncbi:hypothetical protein [Mycobacterium avium]|uniref:hypothetical protein n=1 Tax=Mycobacterium avium TaxID=1764 RepID=UPI000BAEE259|nr:hypothetical protein [Mycobacterium avium]PBA68900.1 hypothetical protein CKJ76_25750 [Mycobacterium avium]